MTVNICLIKYLSLSMRIKEIILSNYHLLNVYYVMRHFMYVMGLFFLLPFTASLAFPPNFPDTSPHSILLHHPRPK